jgi:hypothetical protein
VRKPELVCDHSAFWKARTYSGALADRVLIQPLAFQLLPFCLGSDVWQKWERLSTARAAGTGSVPKICNIFRHPGLICCIQCAIDWGTLRTSETEPEKVIKPPPVA